jgi:hypothetical protein
LLLAGLTPFSIGLLVAITVPVVLPCTLLGVKLYRQMSDVNFRRVTFILLGVSGWACWSRRRKALPRWPTR